MTMTKRVKDPILLTVPGLGRKLTVLDIAPDGQEVLWRKPYSNLFGDNFLEYCLAYWHGKFVVWYYNHQSGGFCNGVYFEVFQYEGSEHPELNALLDALKCFDDLGPKTNLFERMERYVTAQSGKKEVA